MVFKSYMDESGIQACDPYCTIAGYIAPAKEWDKFEHDWRFVLGEYMKDVPEVLRYFHALEFYGNDVKYGSWKPGKKESFINALFDSIRNRELALFSAAVDARAFLSLTEDERRWITGGQHNGVKWKTLGAPRKPYFLPLQFCMIQSANFIEDDDKVFPIMSRQEQYKIKALELYEMMLNSDPALQCRHKLADDIVFSDPRTTPALQAADLAVYWFGKLFTWRAKTGTRLSDGFPERYQLLKLMNNVRRMEDLKLFDFSGLMLLLQGCNRYIRTSFPTRDQAFPSIPVPKRLEILAKMRKVNFRRFLDQWQPSAQEDHA